MQEKNKNARLFVAWLAIVWAFVLVACTTQPTTRNHERSPTTASSNEGEQPPSAQAEGLPLSPEADENESEKNKEEKFKRYPGNNHFINRQAASQPRNFEVVKGDILLNFENTNIREVVKTILGDILRENYVIDPAVQGTVTVQTGRPLPKDALIPTLETLLGMTHATLIQSQGIYKIVPTKGAIRGNLSPRLRGAGSAVGYNVRIMPLRYIGAAEMEKILEPFVPKGAMIRVDPARNLLILAGTARELAQWQETVNIFDVNWLEGMSVGIYKLQYTDPKKVVDELNKVFGPDSSTPLAGMFRFMPIEHLNGVLIITSQSKYLEEAKNWVERLDQGGDKGAERLYVYRVQNGRAENLASLLQAAFGQGGGTTSPSARVAPGRQATQLFSSQGGGFGSSGLGGGFGSSRRGGFGSSGFGGGFGSSRLGGFMASETGDPQDLRAFQASQAKSKGAAQPSPSRSSSTAGIDFNLEGAEGNAKEPKVRIIPDMENNALLIVATSTIYEKIHSALRRLDIPPRQVLVEATIAEVKLTDNLKYGLEWFFNHNAGKIGNNKFGGSGFVGATADFFAPVAETAAAGGGFTYAITRAGEVRALLQMLASDSKLKVLSSPQLLALNNQTAEIRVGDQVPILTGRSALVGGVGGGALTSQVSYKDTGVLLTVTPRVNAGGRVTLEIKQEVTDVGPAVTIGDIQNFTFLQRAFQSVVTVQSGETIVLGGLIRNSDSTTENGVPFLRDLPVIGALFGTTDKKKSRTELIVLMTPRVVRNQREARLVTEEFREKLKNASAIVKKEIEVEEEPRIEELEEK